MNIRTIGLLMVIAGACHAADPAPAPAPAVEVAVNPVYESNWVSYVALGAQFLPDYDEQGRSSGLNKQQFFASMTVDGRFNDDGDEFEGDEKDGDVKKKCDHNKDVDAKKDGHEKCEGPSNPLTTPFHTGVTLSLLGTPIKREDKPSVSPTEFNDVAQTIVGSLYLFSPSLWHSSKSGHHAGPVMRVGAISRESLGSHGDSVNWFYSVGLQYSMERFLSARKAQVAMPDGTKKEMDPQNGVPEGYIRMSAARFEDYAGLGRQSRLVVDAALRIYPKLNVFLGVQGNFGNGPDEFMLVVSMVRQPEEIASLFSLGKK